MTIVFWKWQYDKYENMTIWLIFHEIFQICKFEGAGFKYGNSFLKILAQKYPKEAYLVPSLGIFVFFSQNFPTRQIWGCCCFLKILTQKYASKIFLVLKLRHLYYFMKFVIRQILECWFQIWQYRFQIPVLKYPNQVFLVPNLRIFSFTLSFAIRQMQGR